MLTHFRFVIAALVAIALVGPLGVADTQAQGYFEGKTLTMIVPHSNTGKFGRYAKLLAPAIEKQLKAAAVRVEHHRGGGGLLGSNLIWASKPDGLTFGLTSGPTLMLAQLAGAEGVQFEATGFTYLGRPTADDRVIFVAAGSSIKSIKDVVNLGRPFKVPSQGVDDDFYAVAMLASAFGFEAKFITGYEGAGDTNLSIIRGDTDGRMTSWPSALSVIESGEGRPIVSIGYERFPAYPDVPTALELLDDPEKKKTLRAMINIEALHRTFIAPKGLDPAVTKELRDAISAVLADPAVLEGAKKLKLPIRPMDGATQQKVVAEIYEASSAIPPILKAAEESIK
jgi:tripartite-type tricarboxylate transporter receptor subunit TctC